MFNRWKKATNKIRNIEYKCESCKDKKYWHPANLMLPSIPCPYCNIDGKII